MANFEVTITVTTKQYALVEIEANDWEEAERLAREQLHNREIELEEIFENLTFDTEEI